MIEVDRLSKSFGGRPAVKNVTFNVAKGEILGFLGPNGAGKTTTMRILTGYMPATSGTARVAGFDVFEQSMDVRRRVGYLPENPPLYGEMTVRSYLRFAARIKGVSPGRANARIDMVATQCGLCNVLDRVIHHLSRGYRQRVGLAQALIHEPDVLILDEPTVGLDPAQIVEVRQVIKSLGGEHTIIFSTHILPEVTATCSSVVIINEGEAVLAGPLAAIAAGDAAGPSVRVQLARGGESVRGELAGLRGVRSVSGGAGGPGSWMIATDHSGDMPERIASHVVERGWGLLEMTPVVPSLEEIYLGLISGKQRSATP